MVSFAVFSSPTDSLLVIQSKAGRMPRVALPEFHKIQLLTARVTAVKVNKTARVPAYLCSLDVGSTLCEVIASMTCSAGCFAFLLNQDGALCRHGKVCSPRLAQHLSCNTCVSARLLRRLLDMCTCWLQVCHTCKGWVVVSTVGKPTADLPYAGAPKTTWQEFILQLSTVNTAACQGRHS